MCFYMFMYDVFVEKGNKYVNFKYCNINDDVYIYDIVKK